MAEETPELPARVLVLHRFDDGEIEHFTSKILIPRLCEHAAAFRIRQAGNRPGEPGYWLHLFHLLSGLVDAVVTVELASESYSESIFFEQVLVPQLHRGKTLRSKFLEAHGRGNAGVGGLAAVPVMTVTLLDVPHAEFFTWRDPVRHTVIIDIQRTRPDELISALSQGIERFFATVAAQAVSYRAIAAETQRYEEAIFWGLTRHPLVRDAVTMDAAVVHGPVLQHRANVEDSFQKAADEVADQLLHDKDALAWWSRMASVVSERAAPRTAADKIASAQAKRWQWIVSPNSHNRLRILAYSLAWRLTTRIQILRYRRRTR